MSNVYSSRSFFSIYLAILVFFLAPNSDVYAAGARANVYAENIPLVDRQTPIHLFPVTDYHNLNPDELGDIESTILELLTKKGYQKLSFHKDAQSMRYDLSHFVAAELSWDNFKNIYLNEPDGPLEENALIIFPQIQKRYATLKGSLAIWDGTRHGIRMKGGNGSWKGTRPVFSLVVNIYDVKGNLLMTTYGGVSMPSIALAKENRFVRKEHLFAHKKDKKLMKKGVKKALYPVLKFMKFNRRNGII